MRRIDLIVIHCSASDYPKQTAAWIDADHKKRTWVDSKGVKRFWKGIGYHFFLRHNGLIEVGRRLEEIGSHVKGKNRYSIGVCLAGLSNVPTMDQGNSLSLLLRLLKFPFPNAKIKGHCELDSNKTCPNFETNPYARYFDTLF